ncbi:uncharacterized protein LOC126355288 [Schistocerca gregaria]|uniref:uncharacterized protein LOC126355288 n=1 Tax=Schistocerca gregaria TaxID=7010 RepID=UPI00211F0093|nr:uncharacterized protein LOC126355288 [Schistocerca gregaria]
MADDGKKRKEDSSSDSSSLQKVPRLEPSEGPSKSEVIKTPVPAKPDATETPISKPVLGKNPKETKVSMTIKNSDLLKPYSHAAAKPRQPREPKPAGSATNWFKELCVPDRIEYDDGGQWIIDVQPDLLDTCVAAVQDAARHSFAYIPSFAGYSWNHDFGRSLPPAIFIAAHDRLARTCANAEVETVMREIYNTSIVNADDFDYRVTHFLGGPYQAYIQESEPDSKTVSKVLTNTCGLTALTHSIESATLTNVEAVPGWQTDAVTNITVTVFANKIHFLTSPGAYSGKFEVPATGSYEENLYLVREDKVTPATRVVKYVEFDKKWHVKPVSFWMQPYSRLPSVIDYSLSLGYKIEVEDIDGVCIAPHCGTTTHSSSKAQPPSEKYSPSKTPATTTTRLVSSEELLMRNQAAVLRLET